MDGNTLLQAQFNFPCALILDSSANLLLADRDNDKIKKLDLVKNTTRTLISNPILAGQYLSRPVAMALDTNQDLFVLNQGISARSGSLLKFDHFGYQYPPVLVATNLDKPSAMFLHTNGIIYFTELGAGTGLGTLRTINRLVTNGVPGAALIADLNVPQGLVRLSSGYLAISESASHVLRLVNETGLTVLTIGKKGISGSRDGYFENVSFCQPQGLAVAPSGVLLVADRMNHRVRMVGLDNTVTTLYGIDLAYWLSNFPGWEDGDVDYAEAREPVGLAIDQSGNVYASEVAYHIIRKVTGGANLTAPSSGSGSTNYPGLTVYPPLVSREEGYFPSGVRIYLTNQNSSPLLEKQFYYTTDGSVPTTNSAMAYWLAGDIYYLDWLQPINDLRSLRILPVLGGFQGTIISGHAPGTNVVGVPYDESVPLAASAGSIPIIPVVAVLANNQVIKSLQFKVEIKPEGNAKPVYNVETMSLTNEMFIPYASPGSGVQFISLPYTNGTAMGIGVAFIGTGSRLNISSFAQVAMLKVAMPVDGKLGDRYSIKVKEVYATSDGISRVVFATNMPDASLMLTNYSYLVGDTTTEADWVSGATQPKGIGYGAGAFGDDLLGNDDVNNAFYASVGIRVPPEFSDLFDAMDAFPWGNPPEPGGDGVIRYLDWETILLRSLKMPFPDGVDPNADVSRVRFWDSGFRKQAFVSGVAVKSKMFVPLALSSTVSNSWFTEATIRAGTLENVRWGQSVDVPISVQVAPGYAIGGMQFRATVEPSEGAVALDQSISFIAAAGKPAPSQSSLVGVGDLVCGWSFPFSQGGTTPLLSEGSNYLGFIRIPVPSVINNPCSYTLRFSYVDGAPDFSQQYNLDSIPGIIWVGGAASMPAPQTSDEWKKHYFGSYTNLWAADNMDPDGDGIPNWKAYEQHLDPISLRLFVPTLTNQASQLSIKWFGASGVDYAVEKTSDPLLQTWTNLAVSTGQGMPVELLDVVGGERRVFYRLKRSFAVGAAKSVSQK